jgi:hypothetical protein
MRSSHALLTLALVALIVTAWPYLTGLSNECKHEIGDYFRKDKIITQADTLADGSPDGISWVDSRGNHYQVLGVEVIEDGAITARCSLQIFWEKNNGDTASYWEHFPDGTSKLVGAGMKIDSVRAAPSQTAGDSLAIVCVGVR